MSGQIARDLDFFTLLTLIAHWLSLWLAFYLLSRRPRTVTTAIAASAYLLLSIYFLRTSFQLMPIPDATAATLGAWLGNWIPLAPVLLLHAFLRLTRQRLPRQRALLPALYGVALIISLLGFSNTLLYAKGMAAAHDSDWRRNFIALGPLYAVQVVQISGTLALALWVLISARLDRGTPAAARPQLTVLCAGAALMLLGAVAVFGNAYVGSLLVESTLQPILVLGSFVMAIQLARYPGTLEGQLLRSDLKSSLLGTAAVMTCFVVLLVVAGASGEVIAAGGWFVLAVVVFGDELRMLADHVFFNPASRADRAGLRTAAAYAGSADRLDLGALSPGQHAELIGYLSEVDRAGLAVSHLARASDQRINLLARDEHARVRAALGLPDDWAPESIFPADDVEAHARECLEPRERQAVGLRYLGYSDRQMAQIMGVKPGVPRSYLGEAKRKLGLPAGAPLTLFAFFSGVVHSDALPLMEAPTADDDGVDASARLPVETESPA